jgi:hypothetical protein
MIMYTVINTKNSPDGKGSVTEKHDGYQDYQDAMRAAEKLPEGWVLIFSCEEIWNNVQGELDLALARKIRDLTEAQRYMVVAMVDAGLEANGAPHKAKRMLELPA